MLGLRSRVRDGVMALAIACVLVFHATEYPKGALAGSHFFERLPFSIADVFEALCPVQRLDSVMLANASAPIVQRVSTSSCSSERLAPTRSPRRLVTSALLMTRLP